ncbi:MAG: S8 family serine peptidase [Candidatus Sumerlaeota bacterium]|nr:S8 family serine peptidase [Candidatus Sumerlaeota bacterium]
MKHAKRNLGYPMIGLAALLVLSISGTIAGDDQTGAAPAGPAINVAAIAREKAPLIADFNDLARAFEEGGGMANVIVTLLQPLQALNEAEWNDKAALSRRHQINAALEDDCLSRLASQECSVKYRYENFAGFSGMISWDGLDKLVNDPSVKAIEKVFTVQMHLRQGVPLMNALATRSTYSGAGMAIAICDTGVDYKHPLLGAGVFPNSKVIGGTNTGDAGTTDPIPQSQAHGTCCAGIAAGPVGNTGDYIGGVAPDAKLYAVKISTGNTGSATGAAMIAGWDWCVSHKNDSTSYPIMVISTSFGGGQYFSLCDSASAGMTQAAANAVAAGITVVASSGNDGFCDSIGWPACISYVISVGAVYDGSFGNFTPCVDGASCAAKIATGGCSSGYYVDDPTSADKVTAFSNSASFLTLFAPSNDCYTLDISGAAGYSAGDYYDSFGGTSAACPYAAGAVAALQSAAMAKMHRYLTPGEVRAKLLATGNIVTDPKVTTISRPRVNLGAAIDALPLPAPSIFIHGAVRFPSSAAATPVTVTITDVNGNVVATSQGIGSGALAYGFSIAAPNPLSGYLQASAPGWGFLPFRRAYNALGSNPTGQDFDAQRIAAQTADLTGVYDVLYRKDGKGKPATAFDGSQGILITGGSISITGGSDSDTLLIKINKATRKDPAQLANLPGIPLIQLNAGLARLSTEARIGRLSAKGALPRITATNASIGQIETTGGVGAIAMTDSPLSPVQAITAILAKDVTTKRASLKLAGVNLEALVTPTGQPFSLIQLESKKFKAAGAAGQFYVSESGFLGGAGATNDLQAGLVPSILAKGAVLRPHTVVGEIKKISSVGLALNGKFYPANIGIGKLHSSQNMAITAAGGDILPGFYLVDGKVSAFSSTVKKVAGVGEGGGFIGDRNNLPTRIDPTNDALQTANIVVLVSGLDPLTSAKTAKNIGAIYGQAGLYGLFMAGGTATTNAGVITAVAPQVDTAGGKIGVLKTSKTGVGIARIYGDVAKTQKAPKSNANLVIYKNNDIAPAP